MTIADQNRAGAAQADAAWIRTQVERARSATEAAVKKLGLGDDAAREMANGGGLMLDGWVSTVTVMPLRSGQENDAAPLLVTLDTGRDASVLEPDELPGLMVLASTLLAHRAAVGFAPHGSLCLHRVVQPSEAGAEGIEQALRHVWHLARLLWQSAPADAEVQ